MAFIQSNAFKWAIENNVILDSLPEKFEPNSQKSITGDYAWEVINEPSRLACSKVRFTNLQDQSIVKLRSCKNKLSDRGIVYKEQADSHYLGLPLMANNRVFGVIRLILDSETVSKITTSKKAQLKKATSKELINCAKIISNELENLHYVLAYKRYYEDKTERDNLSLQNALHNYANCVKHSINCGGVIIRIGAQESRNSNGKYIAVSKNLISYKTNADKNAVTLSQELIDIFESNEFNTESEIVAVKIRLKFELLDRNKSQLPFKEYQSVIYCKNSRGAFFTENRMLTISELEDHEFLSLCRSLKMESCLIFKISKHQRDFIILTNPLTRAMTLGDIEFVNKVSQDISRDISFRFNQQLIEIGRSNIIQIHENVADIVRDQLSNTSNSIHKFIHEINHLLKKLVSVKSFVIWELISELTPKNSQRKRLSKFSTSSEIEDFKQYITWNDKLENSILDFNFNSYKEFNSIIAKESGRDDHFGIDIPLIEAQDYGNSKTTVVGVITILLDRHVIGRQPFQEMFKFFKLLRIQISLAWQSLKSGLTNRLKEEIDFIQNDVLDASTPPSEMQYLVKVFNRIASLIKSEFDVDICTICANLDRNKQVELTTIGSSAEKFETRIYSLENSSTLTANSFVRNQNYQIIGRDQLKKFTNSELMDETIQFINREKFSLKYSVDDSIQWMVSQIRDSNASIGVVKLINVKTNFKPFTSQFQFELVQVVSNYCHNILETHIYHREQNSQRIAALKTVAHQILAPLSALSGHVHNYSTIYDDLNIVKRNIASEDIFGLINQASIYTRNYGRLMDMTVGNVNLRLKTISDPKQYFTRLIRFFKPNIRRRRISITFNVKERNPNQQDRLILTVDKLLFEQVFFNLLDNAVKYSLRPRQIKRLINEEGVDELIEKNGIRNIRISLARTYFSEGKNFIEIKVSNWGLEIPTGERAKIFEYEYRGKRAAYYARDGSGIGLYISKKIINLHGGTLELLSTQHPNLIIFKIRLPLG